MYAGAKVCLARFLVTLRKIAKLKTAKCCELRLYNVYMQLVAVIAKFKTHQLILWTDSPNLMPAKFSRYTIVHILIQKVTTTLFYFHS